MAAVHVTKDTFEQEVLKAEGKVLVDFWATWCGPCRMVGPILEDISEEVEGVKICKVDVDKEQELAAKFNVMSIPTMIVFENGAVVEQAVGARPKDAILELLGM